MRNFAFERALLSVFIFTIIFIIFIFTKGFIPFNLASLADLQNPATFVEKSNHSTTDSQDFISLDKKSVVVEYQVVTIMDVVEQLDDISEKIDILTQEVDNLVNDGVNTHLNNDEIKKDEEPTESPSPAPSPLLSPSPLITPIKTPEITPYSFSGGTSIDTSLPQILITEVASGWDKASNEFVELYNPTDQDVTLTKDNFKLKLVNSNNNVTTKRIDGLPKTLKSHHYFLLVAGDINLAFDASFSDQLTYASGVIITDGENNIKDRVGWGSLEKLPPSEAVEGAGIILESGLTTGISLERKHDSENNFIDTDNNAEDFQVQNYPNPKNSSGGIVYLKIPPSESPAVSPTPELSPSPTPEESPIFEPSESPSPSPTSSPKIIPPAVPKIVINEIMYNPDPASDSYYEFIELFNTTFEDIDLSKWKLKIGSETSFDEDEILPFKAGSTIIKSAGFAVIGDKPTNETDKNIYDKEVYSINCSSESICFQIEDAAFGKSGLSNSGTTISLINTASEQIDGIAYLPSFGANGNGKSLEKVNTCVPSNQTAEYQNWKESKNANGTPGTKNSIFDINLPFYDPITSLTATVSMQENGICYFE